MMFKELVVRSFNPCGISAAYIFNNALARINVPLMID